MKKKVTLLDRAGGLFLMLILWVVGSLFCALGVSFLPVVGVFIGLSIILVGTWSGLGLMWPELYAPLESDTYEPREAAVRGKFVPRSVVLNEMREQEKIDPEISEAA
ncbi:MAG: hypothetical protein ACLFVT_01770 [Syntrophobacteria bacterium]